MTVDPGLERPRPLTGAGAGEAVTFAFGDAAAGLFGIARLGRAAAEAEDGAVTASGLAILFADGEIVTARAEGTAAAAGPGWDDVRAAGLRTTVEEPLSAWTLTLDPQDGAGLDLRFEALAPPAVVEDTHPVARAGGMEGYESYCRVTGVMTVGGTARTVAGLGQRGHSWGAPDWDRLTIARTLGIWLDEHTAISLSAVRERDAREHDGERVAAFLIEPDPATPGGPAPVAVDETLLSTTYDAQDCQRAAGLELYVTEDGHPRRLAGEVLCGTTLDLGRLRLDCAFFHWRMEGREGVGRYDILRRA